MFSSPLGAAHHTQAISDSSIHDRIKPTLSGHQPGRNNPTRNSSIRKPHRHASDLSNLREKATPYFKRLATKELETIKQVTTKQRDQVAQLIDSIDQAHNPNFGELTARCQEFLNEIAHNPELIRVVLKYINGQAVLLSAQERQAVAQSKVSQKHLERSLGDLDITSDPTARRKLDLLQRSRISPVLTAHPTNLNIPETMSALMNHLPEVSTDAQIQTLCETLWQGLGERKTPPTVIQEAQNHTQYLQHIQRAAHKTLKKVNQQLMNASLSPLNRPLFEIGNWVGGDRDGNPNIQARTLTEVVVQNSATAFAFYQKKLSLPATGRAGNLVVMLNKAGLGELVESVRDRLAATQMHLKTFGKVIPETPHYISINDFTEDLLSIVGLAKNCPDELLSASEKVRIEDKIQRLIADVNGFGFHGASTDIRQNSGKNAETIAQLLTLSGRIPEVKTYLKMPEAERVELLNTVLNDPDSVKLTDSGENLPDEFKNEIGLINTYKKIHDTYGDRALKNCITANSETLSDMMEVMVLLRHAGLVDARGLHMNVMPLIETVQDLRNVKDILGGMLALPWYRQKLQEISEHTQTPPVQHVMVGYSDSNRLDGVTTAAWAVHKGIHDMMAIAAAHGIELDVFHGRGGTEARGAGHSYEQEVSYLDGASLERGLRQTEQGEVVINKFGNLELAKSNLEELLATMLSTGAQGKDQGIERFGGAMDQIAQFANQAYIDLVGKDTGEAILNPEGREQLAEFFKSTTPINYVSLSNSGSRPPSRKPTANNNDYLNNMRAIPWTESWYQSGSMMPAFYGLGTGLQQFVESGINVAGKESQLKQLKTMYQEWPFFRKIIDRTDMAIHKADLNVAHQYAELNEQLLPVFNKIENEYHTTCDMIDAIKSGISTAHPIEEALKSGAGAKVDLRHWAQAFQLSLMKYMKTHETELSPTQRDQLKGPIVMTIQGVSNSLGITG